MDIKRSPISFTGVIPMELHSVTELIFKKLNDDIDMPLDERKRLKEWEESEKKYEFNYIPIKNVLTYNNEKDFLQINDMDAHLLKNNFYNPEKKELNFQYGKSHSNYKFVVYKFNINNEDELVLVGYNPEYLVQSNYLSYLVHFHPIPQVEGIYTNPNPFHIDWLYFQFYKNIKRFSFQIEYARKPFIIIIPQMKRGGKGLKSLMKIKNLERFLLGVQLDILRREYILNGNKFLFDIKNISLSAHSNGNDTLETFVKQNLLFDKTLNKHSLNPIISNILVFDPPSLPPTVVSQIIPLLKKYYKNRIILFTQTKKYIDDLKMPSDKFYIFDDINYIHNNNLGIHLKKEFWIKDPIIVNKVNLHGKNGIRNEALMWSRVHGYIADYFMKEGIRNTFF